jgi:hypothetical protein
VIDSFLYAISGLICYGIIPVLCSKVGLTNTEYTQKKEERIKKRDSKVIRDDDDVFNNIVDVDEREEDRYLST